MSHAVHASGGRAADAGAVLDPAMQGLTQIVHTYAPTWTPGFQPDHWRGLQPDPYMLRRESDALADHGDLDLEMTAIGIAAQAIALCPELRRVTTTTRGRISRDTSMGVSWIMNAAPPATMPAAHVAARRLLAQAGATDQQLRRRGLPLGPPDAIRSA